MNDERVLTIMRTRVNVKGCRAKVSVNGYFCKKTTFVVIGFASFDRHYWSSTAKATNDA